MHYFSVGALKRSGLVTATGATLLTASSVALTGDLAQILSVAGIVLLLTSAVLFNVLQGQRSAFFRRFLSPNVADLIDHCGLDGTMVDAEGEISIVCADIRNFTRFASANESARVMRFLREYYDAVGAAVAALGGTVKDYAGDGILVLVGAPLTVTDHADRAVKMAIAIREAALDVTMRWSKEDLPIGIGVGVASGDVTVGIVGGAERMEYAAVGPAVNLASRLCGKAGMNEILMDDRTRELARQKQGAGLLRENKALTLKGFDAPVVSFAL